MAKFRNVTKDRNNSSLFLSLSLFLSALARESSTEEQPFQISQKSQLTQLSPAHGIPYVVMDGDTLNSISLKFDTTPAQLARFNKRTLAGFSIFTGDVRRSGGGEKGDGKET